MSSIWNNRLPRIIAPFWCEKDTVLHPDLPKEQKLTPARPLNSLFLVLFLSLVPNITYKRSAQCRIPPIADHPPQPSLFEGKGAWLLYRFSQGLERSMEQVKWEARKLDPARNARGVWWERGQNARGEWWERKIEKASFFLPFPLLLWSPFLNN